ncbi:MAG TPA: alpha-(1-_3)-arabinofuranosyltransferase family protein, partial [Streptosporangiaceae bacterium]|nr:alpha-(1->3)-arabinofuranosyltransferase family protein [Streptosporangiaceae bacterium]
LARSGIRYVIVRNDLNPVTLDYTPPQQMHQALASSGFRRVAAFGPVISGLEANPGATQFQYALPSYRAVEVFAARSAISEPAPPPAVALPVSRTVFVNGGPDALLQLTGQHVLGSAPAVMVGDKLVAPAALWAITDSLPRADHTFGSVDSTPSYVYTRAETNPVDDPLGGAGGPPRQLLPTGGAGQQTVAVLSGAASVTASSSGSWLAETPQIDPVNAFDGNPSTYWAEASPDTPVGQWIQITFSRPVVLPSTIGIALLVSGSLRPVADRLTVTTATGAVTSAVRRTGSEQPLPVKAGSTRTLRVTIAGARGGLAAGPGAGFTGIDIPGVTVTRYSSVTEDDVGRRAAEVAFSFHRQLPSPASLADLTVYPRLARQFVTSSASVLKLSATAIAIPGRGLNALIAKLAPAPKHTLQVTASSTWGSLPSLAPSNLFKAGRQGSWIAGAANPVLRLRWHGKRTIRRMVLLPVPGFGAAPESIKITSPEGVRYASIGLAGFTEIVPPLTTDRMTISFPVVQYATTAQPVSGQPVQLPVGLSKLSIPALAGLRATTPTASTPFKLACGSGPILRIDGRTFRTKVTGTFGDLTQFSPVHVSLCSAGSDVTLGAGRHRLLVGRPEPFTITDLSLISDLGSAGGAGGSVRGRPVRVLRWQPESRQVRIGPGAQAYLELHQNANPGWIATLDGRALQPVTLDGWQQGFVVPAGEGGVISMTFAPARFYHAWIILSAVGAIVLLVFAWSGWRRRRVHDHMDRAVACPVPASPGEPAASISSFWRVRAPAPWWLGLTALCGLMLIIGGPVVIAVPVLVAAAELWPNRYGALAFAAAVVSGLLAALSAHPAATTSGAFGAPAQAFALVALAAALIPARPARSGGSRP